MSSMRRREIVALLGGMALWPLAAQPLGAQAQRSGRVARIGFLYPGPGAALASRIGDGFTAFSPVSRGGGRA